MKKPICFVIMGYGVKTDHETGKKYDLNKTYTNIIKPAAEAAGFQCVRGDEIVESGIIDKSMYTMLIYSDLVIADISTDNPNALYELGVRHAAKPFSTIIMKEEEGRIAFDFNHNKIFKYKHLGDDIGVSEAERCVEHLKKLIETVSKNQEVDSPLFEFIGSIKPHIIDQDEYISIIKDLTTLSDNVYTLVEHASDEMDNSNFGEAVKLWERVSKLVPNETYFVQQYALATYKSKLPSINVALTDALNIIQTINPEETNDPETLGITGAIYKRLWEDTGDKENLSRAIKYYKKGFQINSDYYTGENYAICLLLMADNEVDENEKVYYKIEAKRTYSEIVNYLKEIIELGEHEKRNDIKWIYASYSNCNLLLGNKDEAKKYEDLFLKETMVDWENKTFNKTKNLINNALNK
ncbi:MAG: DUF4071 domain-containing protein [Crocinitomicaceae bacterium]|nr:DUF4071 domain-containing protein [Crocinitomicaceae bacterium]MCF8444694.1 DUF4071 domain-containing protein [Crocinitomicaceae bacterium]